MCYVTSTELKNNLSHYLELAESEDVFVTKNNSVIAVISNPHEMAFYKALAFIETLPKVDTSNIDDKEIVAEGLTKKCGY